ncbi:cation:proton antiporter [Thermodesulfobacteriota bacterium]
MITQEIIVSLLLILAVASILGLVCSYFGLPVMLGQLLAGVILGPAILGAVTASPPIVMLAEWGIFFVMFHTGMELNPRELVEHIWPSLSVSLGGFILPFALGFFANRIFGGTVYQSLFVGLGVSVTAIAVQAVILNTMRINRSELGHIILGAAIANDIMALVVLSTLLGPAKTGSFEIIPLLMVLAKVVAFFGITILIGQFILPRFTKNLTDQGGKAFTFAISAALLLGYIAELAGLHLIMGAFLAGQTVRKEIMDEKIYQSINDRFYGISYGFLVPIFFASLSFHLHLSWNLSFILFSLVIILCAALGKMVGCALGAALFKYNFWESSIIGFGMNGRGAVELVIATLVLDISDKLMKAKTITEPLLTNDQFSVLVLMAFVTTLIAPISLKWAVSKSCGSVENTAFCTLWEEGKRL